MHRTTVRKRNILRFVEEKNRAICYDIVKKALVTSKTTGMELDNNTMCFICPKWADRSLIKKCVENIFNAKVLNVRVINTKGKIKFFRGKKYETNGHKKAMVRVQSLQQMMVGFNEK
jgi:large subunit ribosomal protein L23